MSACTSKVAVIALVLTATTACTQPDSSNNHQADIDAANTMAPPPDNGEMSTYSGNNHTSDYSGNNHTADEAASNTDNGTTTPK